MEGTTNYTLSTTHLASDWFVLHSEIYVDPNTLSCRTRARTVEDKGGVAAEDALGQRLRARRPADLRQRPLQEEEVPGA